MAHDLPERNTIDRGATWHAESVFASPDDWDAAFSLLDARLADCAGFRGTLSADPARLLQWFAFHDAVNDELRALFVYALMSYSVDSLDEAARARYMRCMSLSSRASAATAFAVPEMLQIEPATVERWIAESSALATYRHYFSNLARQRPHTRSAEVEALLGDVADPFRTAAGIHGVLANTDITFRPARDSACTDHAVAHGSIGSLLSSNDRTLRKSAYEAYADGHRQMQHGMAACAAAGFKQNVFLARARGYGSALEAALAPENLPLSVFHTLIETFREHLPLWHRYWEVCRKALGVESLRLYDVRAPLGGAPPTVPYSQAVEWICAGLAPLGEDYVQRLRLGATTDRWVDIYPNRGKRLGAFSCGSRTTSPFIMMSYGDDVFGMSTLAHELGHSMHSLLSCRTQPAVYSRYSMFAAETASNFNQAMVRRWLLAQSPDRDLELALLAEAFSNFHRYMLVMPTLARLELEMHQRAEAGDAITADVLNSRTLALFAEAWGPEVQVDAERCGITWAEFSTHIYSNFYVFQYATGISAAHALAESVSNGGAKERDAYLEFLNAGGSRYPIDALRRAGVDMESPEPVRAAFRVLERMIDRVEQLTRPATASA
ncbi:MAG: oligoendopeptidase F [Armatimonadetes bacterium]|nr:oligoendopeptidase F [Armatimonadota bacterium]MDE2206927.1 oligoendopeptidase F [Armatimonadota bacterium]